jgi:hypothetical protein
MTYVMIAAIRGLAAGVQCIGFADWRIENSDRRQGPGRSRSSRIAAGVNGVLCRRQARRSPTEPSRKATPERHRSLRGGREPLISTAGRAK